MRKPVKILVGLVALYAVNSGALFAAMLQSPDDFARTMKHVLGLRSWFFRSSQIGQLCLVKPGIKFPAVIDTLDNATERAYGRVSYKSGPGPFGFHPQGVAESLQRLVLGKKH